MGDTATGRIVRTVAPTLIMAIAVFMILDELQIAQNIVLITYAALMGAIALGMALAFGLGGLRREPDARRRLRGRTAIDTANTPGRPTGQSARPTGGRPAPRTSHPAATSTRHQNRPTTNPLTPNASDSRA